MDQGHTLLGVGPMSKNCIDATIEIANEQKIPICLVASRGQIETEKFGGGYVNTTENFCKYVRLKDEGGYIYLSRDHGSLWKGTGEKKLPREEAIKRAEISFEQDIKSGFDILHIDVTEKKDTLTEYILTANRFVNVCKATASQYNKSVIYEMGIDKHSTRLTNLLDLVQLFRCIDPEVKFIGGNTGLCVYEDKNTTNKFNQHMLKRMTEMCQENGRYFRQHNADYIPIYHHIWHQFTKTHSINIAPEYGVLETRALLKILQDHNFPKERKEFLKIAYKSKKWKKWSTWSCSKGFRAELAGHYVFTDKRVLEIKDKISRALPLDKLLKNAVKKKISDDLDRLERLR